MSEVVVVIPGTPDSSLSLNGRAHWRVRAKHAAEYRAAAKYAALEGRNGEAWPLVRGAMRVHYVFGWEKGRKRMDFDNCVGLGKSALDGLVDAGIIGDDRYVVSMSVEQQRDPAGVGFVRVEVRGV